MLLSLFLGISAAMASATGIGTGARGVSKISEAKHVSNDAAEQHTMNVTRLETTTTAASGNMDRLGKKEVEILAAFQQFSDLIEKIHNRPAFRGQSGESVQLPKVELEELRKVSVGAIALSEGIAGAALGTVGGFAAAGAVYAAVAAFGTASTGAAIGGLSGAAAMNATLAAIGGGSLAAGGGGIALGTAILGASAAGVGILIGGLSLHWIGSKMQDKATQLSSEVSEETRKVDAICDYLNDLISTSISYLHTLSVVDGVYRDHLKALAQIIGSKTDWNAFSAQEKLTTENTVLLVQLLYRMCQVKLVLAAEGNEEVNRVNHKDVDESIHSAEDVLEQNPFAGKENAAARVSTAEKDHALAQAALLYYFGRCDSSCLDSEEQEVIDAILQPWVASQESIPGFAEGLKTIKDASTFPFSTLKTYLDRCTVADLEMFQTLIDPVVKAANGITDEEEQALATFKRYLSERKAQG